MADRDDDRLLRSLVNDFREYEIGQAHTLRERAVRIAMLAAQTTALVTLFVGAKAQTGRFAICSASGEPVWFGPFGRNDREFKGDQPSSEIAAASRAVRVTAEVKRQVKAQAIRFVLKGSAKWLVSANEVGDCNDNGYNRDGGKARPLGELALMLGIALHVEHIPGTKNPTDRFLAGDGQLSWREYDLRRLTSEVP